MGGCFSAPNGNDHRDCSSSGARTANVITVSGDLREYRVPVTAAHVLRPGGSSSSSSAASRFVCDSDGLYYEEYIHALNPEEELVGGQIYFVLPVSRLQQRLTAEEMAALAVKASLAIQKADEKRGSMSRRRTRTRISPVLQSSREEFSFVDRNKVAVNGDEFSFDVKTTSEGESESPRRLYPSRRLRKAVHSFRIHLRTIDEGSPVDDTDF